MATQLPPHTNTHTHTHTTFCHYTLHTKLAMLCDELPCERNFMSSASVRQTQHCFLWRSPTLRLLVLLITVVFKTTMRISMEHLCCVIERVAGKYYCTWSKSCFTLILSAINLTGIGPGSNPALRGNIHSLLYVLRAYLIGNTRYSRTPPPSFLHLFPLGSWRFISRLN